MGGSLNFSAADKAECIRQILAARGYSLAEIARLSRTRFPRDPRHHIPHNLYHNMRRGGFSPSIHQLFTLSVLSNYRLVDWLTVFGFDLDDIPRLEAVLPTERTVPLDSTVYDADAWIPWLRETGTEIPPGAITPLTLLLAAGSPRRAGTLVSRNPPGFLYVKIGSHDAFAFPDLLPGSIVRIAPERAELQSFTPVAAKSDKLYLVEHSKGLVCCRLQSTGKNRITLRSGQLAFAQVELEVGKEARILGTADLELRPVANARQPKVPTDLGRFWNPAALASTPRIPHAGDLIRRARQRSGLSFRDASARTRDIARLLEDRRYFCSMGALSDSETMTDPPRHVHKLVSLCAAYSVGVWEFLNATGLRQEDAGKDTIPDQFMARPAEELDRTSRAVPTGFLKFLADEFEEIPPFLRAAGASLCGLPALSLRDIFWVTGQKKSLHPYLTDAAFLVVDRRKKKPLSSFSRALWDQPFYGLLLRDGTYLCAACSLQDDTLIVRPFSDGFDRPVRFQNRVDAEVVGRIVAIVRRLSPNS
jgi:transcriptional regulator with XRE-family HTH domain